MATVHVVNPGKRKRKKATTNSAPKKKGGKVGTKKRRRKKSRAASKPVANPTPKRRRRRSHKNPNPKRRRRAHRNPGGGMKGMLAKFLPDLKELGLEIGGTLTADLLMGFAVNRFGLPGPWGKGGANSGYAGNAWSGRNYAIGAAASLAASFALKSMAGGKMGAFGKIVGKEGLKSLARRLFYTEIMPRSPWLVTTFGNAFRVNDDRNGNRYIELADGTMVSMAGLARGGVMGALGPASVYGALADSDVYGEADDDMIEAEVVDDDDDDDDQAYADAEDVGPRPARAIDAGAWDVEGPGRRYYPPSPRDLMANMFRQFAPY